MMIIFLIQTAKLCTLSSLALSVTKSINHTASVSLIQSLPLPSYASPPNNYPLALRNITPSLLLSIFITQTSFLPYHNPSNSIYLLPKPSPRPSPKAPVRHLTASFPHPIEVFLTKLIHTNEAELANRIVIVVGGIEVASHSSCEIAR